MPYIKAPNSEKTYITVPDGLTDDEALAFAKDKYPKLFADVSKAQEGFLPSLKAAGRQLASQYGIAAARPLGMSDEQIRRMVAQEQARQSEIAKAPTWKDVKESAAQYGLFGGEKPEERGGISSLYGMLRGQLAQSLPQMGATIAMGRAGATAGAVAAPFLGPAAPFAPLIGGAFGALSASIPAFVGSGVERQIEEQERAKVKEPLEYGRAVAAAVPSAALDVLETAVVLGRLGMGKMLSSALPKVAEKVGIRESEAALAKAAERSLAGTVGRGAALGVAVEMPTEIAQTVLERWNAKLPLFDEDARKEYEATAVGAGFLGAGFGGIGGISTRGAARDRLGEIQAARAAQEAKQRATQEQAAAQQRAAQGEFEQIPTQFQGQPVQTQTDLFQPVAGVYSPLGQPAAPEEEKPDLREEYRKTKAALDDLSAQMEKAIASKDVDAYATIQPRQAQLQKAVFDIEKEAKDQGIPLIASKKQLTDAEAALRKAMEKGEPAERVQKLAAKVELLRQAQMPGMEGTLFDPAALDAYSRAQESEYFQPEMFNGAQKEDPFVRGQRDLAASIEASRQAQIAKARAAAEKEAKERGLIVDDYGNVVSGKEAQRLGLDIAAAERARQEKFAPSYEVTPEQIEPATPEEVEKYKAEGAAALAPEVKEAQKPKVQQDIDTGYLTPEVQKHLGISLPERKEEGGAKAVGPAAALQKATGVAPKPAFKGYNLNQFDQAQEALPAIQERIRQLSAESRDVAQSGEPVENGKITGLGKRLLDIEGKIKDLERLQKVAQDAPVQEPEFNFQTARNRVATLKEERSSLEALFDPLERLRMGETQEAGAEGKRSVLGTRTKFVEQAKDAATGYENAAVEEANLQRQLNGGSALPKEKEAKLRETVRGLFNKALSSTAGPLEKNRQMSARIEKFLEKVKDPAARKTLLDAQSLFDQNKTSREPKKNALSLTNATENILKNGVNPKTVVVLREAVQATAAHTGKQTDYGPALASIEKQLNALRQANVPTEDPKVQALLRSYRNLFEKQKAATPTAGRGVSGSERKQIMTALNKAIAQAAEVPKGEVKKGPFGLTSAGEKRQAFKEAEAKGEKEVSLGMSPESELAFVQQSIRKLIELGAKRSEVGSLTELLSTKFKTARVGETAKERQLTKEEINKRLAELSALEGKLLDRAGAGELPRFRGYLVGKINEALRIPGLDEKTVAALQEAKDWFTAGRGARGVKETRTGEVVLRNTTQKVAYETTTRGSLEAANDLVNDLTMGRTADTKDLVDALKLEKNVVQEMEAQRDLFVEPGREEKVKTPAGQPPIFTAVKRASAENFQKFQDALKKRFETLRQKYESDTDAEVFKRIDRTDLANLRRDIVALKETLSKSPYANLDATINKLKDSLNSDLDTRLTRVAKSGLDPIEETGFVNALEARRIKFEALKEARAELGESGVINDAVEFADALDKNLQALLVPLAKRYEARRFDQSISNMSGLEKKLLDMLKTAEILRATRKFKFVIGETTAFDAEVAKQTVQIKDLLSKMASRRAAMEVAQRREAIAATKTEREAKRSKVASEMKARGIVRTLEGERTGEGIRTEEEIRSAAELAAEERKATAARGATSRVNLLTKTFANLGREIDFISRGGVAGYNKALKETRASFAESGVPEDSDAFQSALLKRLKENKKTVTLTEEDKKALRKLRSKRTRVGNELSDLIERSVEAEISFDRATFQDLENELKSIESKLKYEKITPQQEKLLAKDRQEIRGILGAYRTGLVAGQAAEPRAKKSRAEKLADAAARRALAKEGGAKTISAVEESDLEDLASFEEGEIPISAGRSPISESRGAVTTENPSDKSTVYKELDRAFKGKNAKDRVTVYDTVAEARAAHPDYADEMHKNTRGFTIGDKTFLVAENINKGKALSVLLHELGVHVGFRNFFSPKEFNALVNVVKSWAGRKDNSLEAQVGRAAMERVEAAGTRGEQINDEILAYAVEEAVDAGLDPAGLKGGSPVRNWFNRIVQAFKSALNKLGLAPDTLTAQNLVDFAYGTANMEMGRAAAPTGAAKDILFSRAESKPAWMSQESWDMEQRVIAKDAPLIKTIKGNVLGLAGITQFVDRFAPIKAALERGVANNKITDLEAAQAIYNFSANDKRMNFLRNVVANGPAKLVKKQEGKDTFFMVETEKKADAPTLIKVFKALGESGLPEAQAGRFFTMYMGAQRVKNEGIGVEALNFGKDEKGNPILTADKLRQFEKDIASQPKVKDAFEKARAIYNEYNKGLIDFAVQTGAISPELAQDLNKKKDYIPFYRQDNGKVHLFIGDEKTPLVVGNLKDQPYLHELIGGDTAIADAFTSSVQNTSMLTDMALRNLATKSTVHMLYKLGMLETATTRAKEGAPAKTYAIRPESGTAGPTVIRFKDKGEDKHVIVKTEGTIFEDIDPELLVKGLEGIKTTFPKALELLGLPAKFLRRAILLSPAYPVRQIVKDSFSVLGTAGADFIPVATPLKNVYSALKGTSKTADTLEKQGLIGGQLLAAEDKEGISTVLRQVTGGKSNISGLIAWLEAKSMMADAGVRASAYDSYRKQGLNELESWIAANELMDFNKRGLSPSMYVANTLVPFFNAQVQGLNVLARAATGRMPFNERLRIQEKFYKRGLALAAMAMLYASMMDDDEAYKNATPQQKYGNWFIRTPFFDEPIKVPIPYEYGLLFKAIPEAIFNTAVKDKPEEYGEVLKALGGMAFASVPGLMPQIAKPFVEAATGVDLYTGEPIESTREKGLDAAQRFRDNTTELSKLLGSIGAGGEYKGISPVMLDHFIKSVGSQTLLASVSLADAVLAGDKPPSATMKTSQTPLLGGFFQPTDAGGIINSTYDLMQKATQSKNTYTKLLEEDGEEAAEQYLNANLGLIVAANSASAFRKQMAEITKYEATIRRSRELTPTEKREMLDDSRQLKIQTATQFREQVRTGV